MEKKAGQKGLVIGQSVIIVLLLVGIMVQNSALEFIPQEEKIQTFSSLAFTGVGPIYIDDNSDFSSLGFAGDGSAGNPYIIEDFNITDASATLIHIQDTTAHFIIRQNLLNGQNNDSNRGIFLSKVFNGIIWNNTIQHAQVGIYLSESDNNTVTDNRVTNSSRHGIRLLSSSQNVVVNNTAYNNSQVG